MTMRVLLVGFLLGWAAVVGAGQAGNTPQAPPAAQATQPNPPASPAPPPQTAPAPPPAAPAQQPGLTTSQPATSGVRPPWEARKTIEDMRGPLEKLEGALMQTQPQNWQGTGASNYVAVVDGARRQVKALLDAIAVIAEQPDRLSNVARLFIALYQVEAPIDSVIDGANQFRDFNASRNLQEALVSLLNQRGNIVKYLLELSEYDEASATLRQREVESCRQQLAQRPTPGSRKR